MAIKISERSSRADFKSALLIIGRNYAPALLFALVDAGKIDREDLAVLLAEVWAMVEFPERAVRRDRWLALFQEAGFVSDPPGLVRPSQSMALYRGCPTRRRRGLAWTTDLEKARWYADRHANVFRLGRANVFAVELPPERVLALINGRKESDVIADVDGLALRELGV